MEREKKKAYFVFSKFFAVKSPMFVGHSFGLNGVRGLGITF